jgi:hypothetical protein
VAFWTTCFKNMLIYLRVSVEWPKTGTSLNLKNYGFFIYTNSTTSWTSWNDFIATSISLIMETTCSTNITGSTWMLSITLSRLGSSSSSMLPYIVVALSSSLPPPISFE